MIVVPVKEGENIERALKKFKRKFEKTGIPDDFTIQFHRLFLLFGLFHHNNAQKEKTLQGF